MNWKKIEESTRKWMLENADSKQTQFWLSVISFFEASILPLPPSTFLIAMVVLGKKGRWLYLALLTTVTSVLGGIFGYIIGFALYDSLGVWIIEQYSLAEEMARIGTLFSGNTFWYLFVSAFTPIPYKAFTIAGGFFGVNLFIFTVASFLGRGLRFVVVAYFGEMFGEHFVKRLFRYFALTTLIAVAIVTLFAVSSSLWPLF